MPALIRILFIGVLLLVFCGAAPTPVEELSDRSFTTAYRDLERELKKFDDLDRKLGRSADKSSNSDRRRVIEKMQQHMIDIVLRREDSFGLEHTIIRHGQPVGDTTAAAEVGTANANKKSRDKMAMGTSHHSPAFQRLARMQQLIVAGERIFQHAVEKQSGAFESYQNTVNSFGQVLDTEWNIFSNEAQRRSEAATTKAAADSVAGGY